MRRDNTELKEIIDALDMTAYLDREGIEYRESFGSRGLQLNVKCCPKCGGESWKVFINAETGLGNCFSGSCEAKFNKYSFVQAHTGLAAAGTIEHMKNVVAELGWRPKRATKVAVEMERAELKLPKSYAIPIKGKNLAYLEGRRITVELAQYFHLRFCHRGWFVYQQEGQERYQAYHNRVLIPVFDLDGQIVSFQGRDITGTAERKYLFPPGYASTGSVIYNGHNVHHCKHVVMGEGAFDVFSLKAAFDTRPDLRDIVPVGSFGKHLSHGSEDSQVGKLLKLKHDRGLETVTFMWDGEPAAIKAAVKAALMLAGHGFKTRVAVLPDGKDPNECSPDEVIEAFFRAVPINTASATKLLLSPKNK